MKYGLIGKGLGHSRSPQIHAALGDPDYELIPLSEEELGPFLTARGFSGLNVTIPYKTAVIPYLDRLSDRARSIGAVNTIVNRGGVLTGYNTDCEGFLFLVRHSGTDVRGRKVLVLGTGGASRAVRAGLEELGAREIVLVSRGGADRTAVCSYEEACTLHSDAQVLVNTTPVGMFPQIDASPVCLDPFPSLESVLDVIYNPQETVLTAQARRRGIPAMTGLPMLAAQAAAAHTLFTGEPVSDDAVQRLCRTLSDLSAPEPGPVTVRGLTLGNGTVRIAAPIGMRSDPDADPSAAPNAVSGSDPGSDPDLAAQALACRAAGVDLIEWRADLSAWQAGTPEAGLSEAGRDVPAGDVPGRAGSAGPSASSLLRGLARIRAAVPDVPLLFTLRTRAQGGAADLTPETYESLLSDVIALGRPDLADIEFSAGDAVTGPLLALCRRCGVRSVLSHHDTERTAPAGELLDLLARMDAAAPDLLKLAVTPTCEADVDVLLDVTRRMHERTARPLITMSMGALGVRSRFEGGAAGSCLTFASVVGASAPGQPSIEELKEPRA